MDVPLDIGPGQATRSVATAYAHAHPGSAPAGSNDFACEPSATHPRPVVLAHGTDTEAYADWAAL
ncbi:lipase, partial [Rhodococcus erythropolis]|nr:lipase [Rhodococcus erythropolis]